MALPARTTSESRNRPLIEKYRACQAEGRAWIPDQNNGAGGCGDALVSWCCKEEEVLERFPAAAEIIKGKLKSHYDNQYQISQCSLGSDKTTIHLLNVKESPLMHRSVEIKGLLETDTGNAEACPVDLAALIKGESGSEPVVPDEYEATIAPLVEAKCGGSACHANGNTFPRALVGDKARLLSAAAAIISSVEARSMPINRDMSDGERSKLVDYLKTTLP